MSEIIKPRIELSQMDAIQCEKCGSKLFTEVSMLKKVPALMTGAAQDTIVPFPTYACKDCGHVNDELNPFFEDTPKIEL
jgi:DNA-directed RNA polymerase subunit RPC12/RpoP